MFAERLVVQRLRGLEQHLKLENPVLVQVVQSFRELDRVGRRVGFLQHEESYAERVPWWPLVSILGTYSSGKSTFLNHYLRHSLQATGNQAVDDKFTVICYSSGGDVRVLPGLALDADPRFPFFQIREAIEDVEAGEGARLDAYVQLKTAPSERLRGRIFIDSPGFDADAQRTSTLRLTDHIVDLSDLVLVFFDARHPEPGSMHDTLEHLVKNTVERADSTKFLYILNQIDNTAREDNPEQVFAAWQRALVQHGLASSRCYSIYNPDVAIPISDPKVRARFEAKRDADMAEIFRRIDQVGVERTYRIVGMLEQTVRQLEHEVIPLARRFLNAWRRRVWWLDAAVFGSAALLLLWATSWAGWWEGLRFKPPVPAGTAGTALKWGSAAVLVVAAVWVHFWLRNWAATRISRKMLQGYTAHKDRHLYPSYANVLRKNSRWTRSLLSRNPLGWGPRAMARLKKVVEDADRYVQALNDRYTNPSGDSKTEVPPQSAPEERTQPEISAAPSAPLTEPVAAADPTVSASEPTISREDRL
jgi:hypothetical protein